MKRSWILAAMAVAAAAGGYGLQQTRGQAGGGSAVIVGVVDMMRLFNSYDKTKWLNAEFERQKQRIEQEITQRDAKLKTLSESLGYYAPDSEEYRRTSWELVQARAEREAFLSAAEYQVGNEHRDLTLKTYKEIEAMIASIAQRRGIDVVLTFEQLEEKLPDSNAVRQQIRFRQVIYYHPRTDITNEVLDALNRDFQSKPKPTLTPLQTP